MFHCSSFEKAILSVRYRTSYNHQRIELRHTTKQNNLLDSLHSEEISDSSIRVFLIQDNPANSVEGMTMVLLKEKPASSRVCGGFFPYENC